MPEVMTDMFVSLNSLAGAALGDVVETMAFLCAEPVEDSAGAPSGPCVRLSMAFAGPANGFVEIVAPEALGTLMTGNMLCSDVEAASVQARRDVLLELLNMTCGVLFRAASNQLQAKFDIALPRLDAFECETRWDEFRLRPGASVLNIDGLIVAIGVFPCVGP